ncbi:hypothetical protein TVWG_00018 [Tetraselmis viridis virus N1]|nr:hypothetical protein TVWG_00018 [Tetraselmis viridis virus N1]
MREKGRLSPVNIPERADASRAPSILPHPYSQRDVHGTLVDCRDYADPLGWCRCCAAYDTSDGYDLCLSCGWVGGSIGVVPPAWHGTHTIIKRHTYDPSNYMKIRLRQVGKGVPMECMETIMTVFPSVYDAFRKHCKERKNMICYGFVISRLLAKMGLNPDFYNIKTVKTPSKKKENLRLWRIIEDNCPLNL